MAGKSTFTDEKRQEIIEGALLSIRTGQSLRSFCIANDLPYATVWDWLNPDGLTDNSPYARAREIGTHYLAEECLEIADESRNDVSVDAEGHEVTNHEVIQRSKLRIDTRLRLIGKWNRKAYGDKTEVDHTSSDGSMTPKPNIIEFVSPQTDDAGSD